MEGVELLEQAAKELVAFDPTGLSDEELREALVRWQRAESRLVGAKSGLVRVLERRRAYRQDGSKSTAAWLARRTKMPLAQARAQTRLARRLAVMPQTEAALAAGQIGQRHAEVLAALADSARQVVAGAFGEAEDLLVGFAKDLCFEDFVSAVRQWEYLVDADGVEQRAGSDHESRHLHLSQTFRGNWRLDGQLDVIAGTEVAEALRRISEEMFRADWADAQAVHGDDTREEHLARTARQRRADALAEMARRSMTAPIGGVEPRPLIVVHVGDDSLKRLCELACGTPVTPGQLVPLVTDADLERIVYAGRSRRVIELGARSRLFTGALRRAILLRDRHCRHPSCRVPADQCEVDHRDPVALGGRTDRDNGEAECGSHNRHKGATRPDQYPGNDPPPDTS